MATPQQDLIDLYENLVTKYKVTTSFAVGLGHNLNSLTDLSSDVITLIKHLSGGNVTATDTDEISYLKLTLFDKISGDYLAVFEQNTNSYMEVFDMDELVNFLSEYDGLINAEPENLNSEEPAQESTLDDFYE
jgi:hypothetical protein